MRGSGSTQTPRTASSSSTRQRSPRRSTDSWPPTTTTYRRDDALPLPQRHLDGRRSLVDVADRLGEASPSSQARPALRRLRPPPGLLALSVFIPADEEVDVMLNETL